MEEGSERKEGEEDRGESSEITVSGHITITASMNSEQLQLSTQGLHKNGLFHQQSWELSLLNWDY